MTGHPAESPRGLVHNHVPATLHTPGTCPLCAWFRQHTLERPDPAPPPRPVPGGLDRRVAEVTHALMEAWVCSPPGWVLEASEVAPYYGHPEADTAAALAEAKAAGMADDSPGLYGTLWEPSRRAWALRGPLEEYYYAT